MFNIVRRDEGDVTVQHPDYIYFREYRAKMICRDSLIYLTRGRAPRPCESRGTRSERLNLV